MDSELDELWFLTLLVIVIVLARRRGVTREKLSTLSLTGKEFVHELIDGSSTVMYRLCRMEKHAFHALCDHFKERGYLSDSKHLDVEEKMVIFLMTLSHTKSNRYLQSRFQHSGQTINKYFHEVLQGMLKFAREMIVPPSWDAPTGEIRDHRQLREGPFKGAVGALDDILIHAVVPHDKQIPFRGRGGEECFQNVMAICDFDMKFTYVVAGWEGVAHDSRVLCEAKRKPSFKFPMPPPGNELPMELCQTLLKMAPTTEEELKLRLFDGELTRLGPAEKFLKVLINIPFAFKRLESLSFMTSYEEDFSTVKDSLATLEVACDELRNSRLFLKLLEAVLKTGNRMNDGTFRGGAQAFKLDTLLKLADVKGADGKTTLLQFVVQEIIRSEGRRAARMARESESISSFKSDYSFMDSPLETEDHYRSLGLQVVSHLGSELENVKKASVLDADGLSATVAKLSLALSKSKEFLNIEMKSLEDEGGFHLSLKSFVENAEAEVALLQEEEKRIMALVRNTGDYFHGSAKKDEGLRLFVIVRSFLAILEKTCKEVKDSTMKPKSPPPTTTKTATPANKEAPSVPPSPDLRQRLLPAIVERRLDSSSSSSDDDEF